MRSMAVQFCDVLPRVSGWGKFQNADLVFAVPQFLSTVLFSAETTPVVQASGSDVMKATKFLAPQRPYAKRVECGVQEYPSAPEGDVPALLQLCLMLSYKAVLPTPLTLSLTGVGQGII